MKDLQFLGLQGCGPSEEVLSAVSRLSTLRALNIAQNDGVHKRGLQDLKKLPGLEELVLDGCKINDDDLGPCAEFPALKKLSLKDCKSVSGNVFRNFEEAKLEELNVENGSIRDVQLRFIAQIKSLKTLNLKGCLNITEGGIKQLPKLTSLTPP